MFNRCFVIALVVLGLGADLALSQQVDATAFCSDCHGRRNGKDLYANTADCHSYYQCFFYNETYAIGFLRQCPSGQYWNDRYFTCVFEGTTPCVDVCESDAAVQTLGCAAVTGSCSTYIFCAAGPQQMCCPSGTVFNAQTCNCDEDTAGNCTDVCVNVGPVSTSLAPPVVNGSYCIDSFGNTLTNGSSAGEYVLVDPSSGSSTMLQCALGSEFDLSQCLCGTAVAVTGTQPSTSLCSFYMPLDGDAIDVSINHFTAFIYDNVSFVNDNPNTGIQSAWFQGGSIEIPGLKSFDLQWDGTWCAFFKCANGGNCTSGGILSNNNNENSTSFSFILSTASGQAINVEISTQYPSGEQSLSATATSAWNQVCVVFNGTYSGSGDILVYVNNQLATNSTVAAWTNIGHCPYAVGHDQAAGYFYGNVAQVLLCEHAFSSDEVNAHYQGPAALAEAGLIPTVPQ